MKLAEFKQKNPAYANVPDDKLADALHKKFYSNIDRDEFMRKAGVGAAAPESAGLLDRIGAARRGMQAETNENLAASGMPTPDYRSGTTPQQRATLPDSLATGSREALIEGRGPRTLRADATEKAGLDAFTAPDDNGLLNMPSTQALIGRESERAKLEATRGANIEALRQEGEKSRRLEGADAEQYAREEYERRFKAGDSKGVKPAEADWSTTFGLGATRAGRGLARGFYGTVEAFGDMLGSADLSKFGAEDAARQEAAMAKAIRDAAGAVPEEGFKSIVADALPTVISQGAPIMAATLAAVATRNPAAVQPFLNAAVLTPMGVQKFGENYRDAKARGLATEDRVSYALGGALAEVIPERLSLGVLFDVLAKPLAKGGKEAAQKGVARELAERFLVAQGTEMATEEITTVADFILEQHYLDPDLSLKELQDRMVRTALVTPVATTALMGAGAAGSVAGNIMRNGVSPRARALRELQDTVDDAQFTRDGARVATDLLSPSNAQYRERQRPDAAWPEAETARSGMQVSRAAAPVGSATSQGAPTAAPTTPASGPAAQPAAAAQGAPAPAARAPLPAEPLEDASEAELLQQSILEAEQESAKGVPEPSQMAQEAPEARGPEGAPEDVRPRFTHVPGNTGVAGTERGMEIPFQYALVEADSIQTSQLDDLSPNPAYPQELQPRDRTRAGSEMQIARMASDIKPRRLGEAPMVSEGAPVVGPDGAVESGNGRTIALRRAYAAGKAKAYYDWLEENAGYFGFDPVIVARMKSPMLVRVRTAPVDRLEFVRQANESALLVMSPVEQARADAARIDSMDDLAPTEDGDFASSRDFIRRFVGRLPATEQAGLITAEGRLSQAGYARVRNAILARAYGDSPVLTRLVESMDDNLRNIGKALVTVAPAVAKVRADMADGALFDVDLTPDLIAAVETLSRLKDEGRAIAEELAQMGMLDDGLSAEARELLAFLADNVRRPRKIAEFILRYTEALRAAGNPNQGSLLGETQAPTKAELLAAARGQANEAAIEQQPAPAATAEQPAKPAAGPAEPAAEDRVEPAAEGRDRRRAQGNEGRRRPVTPQPAPASNETPADAGVSASGDPVGTLAYAEMPRQASTFDEARTLSKAFQGRPLRNRGSGITATVSRNNLDKMLSASAVGKSTSAADHSLAVANLDHLFANAQYGWVKQDRDGDPNITGIHRLFAAMDTASGTRVVKLTVKESARADQGSKIYAVEALEIDSPASIWVDSTVRGDGLDPTSTPYAGLVQSLVEAVRARNASELLNPKNGKPFSSITVANQVRKKQADPDAWGVYRRGESFVLRRWDADTGREVDPNWHDQKRAQEEATKRAEAAPAEPLLQSYTAAEIAAQEAAQREREEAEARAEREAAERDRKAREQAEVRARSEAAANTFELGMDPMENLTGQGGLFGQSAPAPQPTPAPQPAAPTASANTIFTEDAAEKARALLRRKLGQLNSGIDPEMLQAGITLAGYHIEKGARTFAAYARAMLGDLGEAVRPYLKSWYVAIVFDPRARGFEGMDSIADVQAADENADFIGMAQQEQGNGTDERGDDGVEPDRRDAEAQDGMGAEGLRDGARGDAAGRGRGVQGAQGDGGARRGGQLPGRQAAPAGERGDLTVYTGATDVPGSAARSDLDRRSADPGIDGAPVEPDAAESVKAAARGGPRLAETRAAQAEADAAPHGNSLEDIRAALPALLPGQQEDVFKAEQRFAKPDGYGMLFTNGTGTGKTFTGLGIVKRFALAGKTNTLIVAPNDKIIEDWQKSGRVLGLDITRLQDTQDAGRGIVVTTYANFGDNAALVSRDWDLVVSDESHYLMQDKDGTPTSYLRALRAITLHPDGVYRRHEMLNGEELDKRNQLAADAKMLRTSDDERQWAQAEKVQAEADALSRKLEEKFRALEADVQARQGAARPRAVFLSATPFAYEKTIDWANGCLFDYNEGQPSEAGSFRGYNSGSNRDRFFMQHLGYRMRYGKLTQPDAKVDSGLMQRQFNTWLKKKGSLSGRMLEVDFDYDRRFILVDSAIGTRIDAALTWLREEGGRIAQAGGDRRGVDALQFAINEKFDYLSRRYLLEAIKASEVIPHVREHLAMGRKVVVFHDYKKGGGFNPFVQKRLREDGDDADAAAARKAYNAALDDFNRQFADLVKADFAKMPNPIEAFQRAFPDVLLFNGNVPKNQRRANVAKFQDDASGPQVILVQSAAGKEGISLHDTTGKHQRALFNLGQPTQPTTAIQQEGRIYRTGQKSDAIFRYLNTGTNWEKWAFATTIAQRASAAENLGAGEQARALKDAFIQGFEESDNYRAGMEGEGKGGKERDRLANAALTEYDRAKAFYFGQQKKTSKTKAQEGTDYFATPEPVGLKMVEWADVRPGERVLEPSAGHGAIARWMPENAERTAIEPSSTLLPRLAMVFDGKIVDSDFESLHVNNKFDAIVMNPPFGQGGKTAIEHVAKAATHLRERGRIVALIPTGSAADKRFEKWFYEAEERPVKPIVQHDFGAGPVAIYRGDTVRSRAAWAPEAVVVRRAEGGGLWVKVAGRPGETQITLESLTGHTNTGPRTEAVRPAEGLHLIADIKMPGVTFERAGTRVTTRIVVIEKQSDPAVAQNLVERQRDYTSVEDVGELFDRLEDLALPRRAGVTEADAAPAARAEPAAPGRVVPEGEAATIERIEGDKLVTDAPEVEHTTQKGKKLRGVIARSLTREQAQQADAYTFKKDGGFFVRLAHVTRPAAEPGGRYTVEERGARARIHDGYTQDLFGAPVSETGRVPDTPLVQPGIAGAETLRAAGQVEGAKYAVEAGPRVTGFLKSAFARVESAPHAAHTLAGLRKNAAEHFQALVLDAENRPISVLNLFAGAIAQTSVYPEVVTKAIYETPGAAKVWFAHNHPSGKPEPSNADAILTRNLSEAFGPGTGIEVAGHVVIAGTRAAELDSEGFEVGRAFNIPAGARTQSIKITERRFKKVGTLGPVIDSPDKARADVPVIAEGKPGVVFLNAQHGPVGFLPMSAEQMRVLRDGKGARLLFGAAARSNASAAILHFPAEVARADVLAASTNLYEALNPRDIRVLDALHGSVSLTERGELTGTGRGFLSRSGQASGSIGDLRIDLADLEAVAVRHRKTFPGIPVIVARNEDVLPEALRKQLMEADAYGDTAGVFWEGTIYLLRSGIEDIAHAEHTVVHEATHAGLAAMFGPELDAVMLDIWRSSIKVQLRAGRLRRRYSYSNVRATEEALADLGGEMVKVSGFKKLVAFIRNFFRARGWVSAWSDNDVAYLVQRAREYGKKPGAMTVSRTELKRSAGRSALLPSRKEAASFRAALKTAMSSMRSTVSPINVMTTPPVLQMLGAEALPITISRDVVRKATNGIKHDVTLEAIERLPEALANPVMVLESATQAGDLIVLTEHKDSSGRPVMFAVALSRTRGRGYLVSEISSAYGRKPSEYMSFVERGLLRYRNTAKSPDWLSDNGLQLPNSLSAARGSAEKGLDRVRDRGLQLPKAGSPSQGLWESVPTEADAVNWAQTRLSRAGQQSAIPPQPPGPVPPQQQGMPLAGGARGTNWDAPAMSRLDNFIQTIQDKFIDLKRVQQAINETGNAVPERFDAYLAEELYHGRVATRTKRFLNDEVKPLLREMQEKGVTREALETYLHARHAPEANAAMAEANPNQQEIDVGRMQADAQVRTLEAQLQQATAAGRSTRAIEDALRQAREERLRWSGVQAFRGTEAERLSLSGMSDADAAAHMASLTPAQQADMAALAARIDAINARTLRETERYGLMDAATLDAWRNKYQFYVPLHRDEAHADSVNHPIGQGYSNKGDTARRRTGSNEKVTNILGHILMQREAALTRGEKNVVGLTLYGLALQNPNPDFWSVDRAPRRRTIDPDTGFVIETTDPTYKNKPNVFVVRVKGEDRAIVFNERNARAVRMAAALKNLDVADMGAFFNSFAKVTRYFASINTQYNPIFGIVNVVRDVQGAMINLASTPIDGKQAEIARNVLPAMRAIWSVERDGKGGAQQWRDLWNEMQEVGGITGYRELFRDADDRTNDLEREMKKLERGNAGKYAHAVLDWLTDYNVALENAVRLAAYKAALDAGHSKKAAASLAKNLTVNFNRKGRIGRELGAGYAFFNASVQGTARLVETMRTGAKPGAPLGKKGMKIIAGGLGLGMLQAVLGALFFDEDDWDKIPEFVKQTNTIIPIGAGQYVTIPMPLGLNAIPNFGRVLTELALDGGKDAGKRTVDLLAFTLSAFDPLGGSATPLQYALPTVLDPVAALAENKDWKGQPIARKNLSPTDPEPGHRLAKDGASEVSRWLAWGFNRVTFGTDYRPGAFSPTPDQIDYVFGQIFGGVGREALKLTGTVGATVKDEDLPAYRIPLAGRFYGNTADAKGNANRYYANAKLINELENELKGRAKDGKDVGAFMRDNPLVSQVGMANGIDRAVSGLQRARREIDTLPGLTDRQRYEQKREIDIQIGRLRDQFNQSVKQVERGGQKTLREWVRERATQ